MEGLIRKGLTGVDEDIIVNVTTHLKTLGMTFAEDCQYVEEEYLKDILKPIQVKKLLSFFKKFCLDTLDQPSTLKSSFEFTIEPKKSWAEDFPIPWDSFPIEVLSAAENGIRIRKDFYSEMVRVLSESISRVNPSPGRYDLRIIAKKIVARYPETFQDKCGDSVMGGNCSTLMKKVENCLENRRRRKKFSDIFESYPNGQNIKKTTGNSYGCINWQPIKLPDRETKSSQVEHKIWLRKESTKLIREEDRIDDLMLKSYASQRYIINSKNPINVIKEEWPTLFENKHFFNHASVLLGKESICDTILNNISVKGKIIFNFMKSKKNKSPSVSNCLIKIKSAKTKQESISSEILGAILLIPAFFSEKEDDLFQINTDPVTIEDLEEYPGKLNPFIATSGGDVFSADEYYIVIDGIVALQTTEFQMAVALLIMSFFVFNIEYTEKVASTLEFIQRVFAEINPQRGNKMSKKEKASNSKNVLKFVKSLSDFENHFNL